MSITVEPTEIPEVLVIKPRVFRDPRGFFMETFHAEKYAEAGIRENFVQDNHSFSTKGILRGLHYQLKRPQGKLVQAVSGEIFDVAVDIRKGSPTFGKWVGVTLSERNKWQIYVPPGFAHGFYVVSETANVTYKCTDFYDGKDEYGIQWSDPEIGIDWQLDVNPVLSPKDELHPALKNAPKDVLPEY
ncbi:MAG: dTDP-4-dehydrorhamnose 3,5-epimerase [Calditrichaeota bacterium]|nr:dTDP-4-dehydrorhamnose 3,5-epimerase [Calditrichota bacterium]MCB0270849.1 dTDP-4-dehydrorhamnose 3,5-epimerase [Calditrichota bacterium]MCB0285852.1 dTDP-4-dehydrorhamnose 3,5-epimerase [Calditrichota bacterium]MCB0300925.1 dTDP-4-dehydrorhamnose 3,5-epimerase [Calditrichota bacterium]MCB9066450.1 dTDP-4-dehydrorhamnose 3,5-epimerase [Calditrichia bacterium]